MTRREREQFEADVEQFGERVAQWLFKEAQGWSALDELIYWHQVRKTAMGAWPSSDRLAA